MSHEVAGRRMLVTALALCLSTPFVAIAQSGGDTAKQPASSHAKPKDPQRSGGTRAASDPPKHAPVVTTELSQKQPTTVQKQGNAAGAPSATVRAEGTKGQNAGKQLPNDRPERVGTQTAPAKNDSAPVAKETAQGKGAPVDKAGTQQAKRGALAVRNDGLVGSGKGANAAHAQPEVPPQDGKVRAQAGAKPQRAAGAQPAAKPPKAER